MRPTLLGSLLDAARTTPRATAPTSRSSSPGPSTARTPDGPPPTSTTALGVLLSGRADARAPGAAAAARRLLRREGAARGAARRASMSAGRCSRRRCRSCTPAAPPRCSPAPPRAAALGFLGELHPLVAGVWDLPRAAAFAIDLGKLAAARSRRRRVHAVRCRSRRCARTSRSMLPEAVPRPSCSARARGGRQAARRRERVRRLQRRAGRRGPALARARALLPRGRPHAHRRGRRAACASASSRRSRSSAVSCVASDVSTVAPGSPRVLVAGATGFAGALAAQLLWRHPGFELAAVSGRSEVGRRLEDLYPRYRVPLAIEELDARRAARARRRGRRLPARRRGADRRRAARARRSRRRPLRRLPPARPRDLRALVRRASAAGAARRSRLRPHRAAPPADRRGRDRREPRLLSDGRRARARAARPRRADRGRRDRRQAGRLGRRARADETHAPVDRRREHPPLQGRRATAIRPRSSSSWTSSIPPTPS